MGGLPSAPGAAASGLPVNVELVDYSHEHYSLLPGGNVPPERGGKFVQLRSGDCEYIVLAPRDMGGYHAGIVELFCARHGLTGHLDRGEMRFEIHDPGWSVAGGGTWLIDTAGGTLLLSGRSKAYGRFDRASIREGLSRTGGRLCGWTVTFGGCG